MTYTFYVAAWLTWQCPGGILSGYVPNKLKPLICDERVNAQEFSSRDVAEKTVDAVGPSARPRLWRYQNLRRTELPVTFKPK